MSISKEFAELRAHDGEHLKGYDVEKDKGKRNDTHDALDVGLDEPTASLPVEAPPRIHEANAAGSTEDLGNDLAAKGAVKGHNGVLVLGQERGFDTDLGNNGRHAQEEGAAYGDGDDCDPAEEERRPLCAVVIAEFVALALLGETEPRDEAHGEEDRNVRHDRGNGSGEGEGLPLLTARDAVPEADVAGHGDDLVGPGGVQVGSRSAGDGGNDDSADGKETREECLEQTTDPAQRESVDHLVAESPPAGELASLAGEVADGGAHRRGDGLLVDEGDLSAGLEEAFLLIFGGGLVVVVGHSDGGGGSLHHGEHGEDICERVLHLVVPLARAQRSPKHRKGIHEPA